MKSLILALILTSVPACLIAQYSDDQIPGVVRAYFQRNRTAPRLIRVDTDQDYIQGRLLRIKIQGNRNSANDDIGFAFGAAAAVANRARRPFDTIWIEMDVLYKNIETTIALAPAPCSIEAIVQKNRSFQDWWDHCLEFL